MANPNLKYRSYPELSNEFEDILVTRSNLNLDTIPAQFTFSKFKGEWIYIYINLNENQTVPNVAAFGLCLITTVILKISIHFEFNINILRISIQRNIMIYVN